MKRTFWKLAADLPRVDFGRLIMTAALVGAGLLAGAGMQPGAAWGGDVKDAAPPQAYQSGAQLSVPILKEIAATLHQMDARIAKIETLAQQWRPKPANAGAAN